jgi:hypothetical protein
VEAQGKKSGLGGNLVFLVWVARFVWDYWVRGAEGEPLVLMCGNMGASTTPDYCYCY